MSTSTAASTAALPYQEPSILVILIISSFLFVTNVVGAVLDRLLFCGLVGQIFIGITWGTPGGQLLSESTQKILGTQGYLGLIGLIYEGGLSVNLASVRAHVFLSSTVALIGVSAPIGLSFLVLKGFLLPDISARQAFAAGAALCSTSLGTTFTVLATSGLAKSRLATVLTSAAMMDDVVGLIMTQVIASLGSSNNFNPVTVIRPVFTAIAFATLVPLFCVYALKSFTEFVPAILASPRSQRPKWFLGVTDSVQSRFLLQTALLTGLVAGTSYAGTSNLLGAYIAGATIAWWDGWRDNTQGDSVFVEELQNSKGDKQSRGGERPSALSPSQARLTDDLMMSQTPDPTADKVDSVVVSNDNTGNDQTILSRRPDSSISAVSGPRPRHGPGSEKVALTGAAIYSRYYAPAVETILRPLFFASIGFSVPITRMFTGAIIWRGLVYAVFMALGKMLCGLCLIRFQLHIPLALPSTGHLLSTSLEMKKLLSNLVSWMCCILRGRVPSRAYSPSFNPAETTSRQPESTTPISIPAPPETSDAVPTRNAPPQCPPRSLYPAAMLGSAMVARGEIGFLISSLAQSDGVFSSPAAGDNDRLFLVVTWAILLCTIGGPVAVGLLTRRVRRLQTQSARQRQDVEHGDHGAEGAAELREALQDKAKLFDRDDAMGAWGVR